MKKAKLIFGAAAALVIAAGVHDGARTAYDGDLEESAGLERTDMLGELAKHVLFAVTLPGEIVGTGAGKLAYRLHPMAHPENVFR